jgi:hypothetical protein
LLPNASILATKEIAESNPFRVVANTNTVQAVSFDNNRTTMATFWNEGQVLDFYAVTPCQVTWEHTGANEGEVIVALSDPTQEASRLEIILLNSKVGAVKVQDKKINSTRLANGNTKIVVDTTKSFGKTFTITYQRLENKTTDYIHILWLLILVIFLFLAGRKRTMFQRPSLSVAQSRNIWLYNRDARYTILDEEDPSTDRTLDGHGN